MLDTPIVLHAETMRKLLLIFLMLSPWLAAHAQPEAPQVIERALDVDLTFRVTHATTMADGSPITGVTETRFYWTPRTADGMCGDYISEVGVAWPGDTVTIPLERIGAGDFCVFAYYIHPACLTNSTACEAANHVALSITDSTHEEPEPEPEPQLMLAVADGIAYYPFEQGNRYAMIEIGTFPIGTPCLAEWPVGEYYLVDTSLGFEATLPGQVVPQVLVANCE